MSKQEKQFSTNLKKKEKADNKQEFDNERKRKIEGDGKLQ